MKRINWEDKRLRGIQIRTVTPSPTRSPFHTHRETILINQRHLDNTRASTRRRDGTRRRYVNLGAVTDGTVSRLDIKIKKIKNPNRLTSCPSTSISLLSHLTIFCTLATATVPLSVVKSCHCFVVVYISKTHIHNICGTCGRLEATGSAVSI